MGLTYCAPWANLRLPDTQKPKEPVTMHYYRLLHPHSRIDDLPRSRRQPQDQPVQRVYQLPNDRTAARATGRR